MNLWWLFAAVPSTVMSIVAAIVHSEAIADGDWKLLMKTKVLFAWYVSTPLLWWMVFL